MTMSIGKVAYQDLNILMSSAGYYSQEAAGQAFYSLEGSTFEELFESIFDRFNNNKAVNYITMPLPPVAALDKVLNLKKFSGVKDEKIQIPVGLNAYLTDYVDFYEKTTLKLLNLLPVLDQFYKLMGKMLNTPDLAQAQSSMLSLSGLPSVPNQHDTDTLSNFFDGSERTEAPFGAMVNRVGEYVDVYQRVDHLNRKAATVPISEIYVRLQRFEPIVRTLRKALLANNVSASGPFASKLIEQAATLAAATSILGSYKHAITELVSTTQANYDRLTKV